MRVTDRDGLTVIGLTGAECGGCVRLRVSSIRLMDSSHGCAMEGYSRAIETRSIRANTGIMVTSLKSGEISSRTSILW